MALPRRAKPLLKRLEEFLDRPDLTAFRNEAAERFLGSDRLPLPEEATAFRAYAMYAHKGADGRGLIDRFLEAEGANLDPEERRAFRRMREAVFGYFRVDEVWPGKGFRVTRIGTFESYEIVEARASRTLIQRDGFFGWIVPYLDSYELALMLFSLSPGFTYFAERCARRYPEALREELEDPIQAYRFVKRFKEAKPPPENRMEAEIFAAHVFGKVGFPLSVEEVQKRFQTLENPFALLRDVKLPPFESDEDLRLFAEAVGALWNFTPREDLGGRSPTEVRKERESLGFPEMPRHLVHDFLVTALAELGPELEKHPQKARDALRERFERWLEEPQEELGGRSPSEFVEEAPRRFPLPNPESLPPPGRPIWTAEKLEAKAAEFLRRGKLHGLAAIVPEMARRGVPIPEEVLRRLLDEDDDWILDCLFAKAAGEMSRTQGERFARLVAERIHRLRDWDCAFFAYEVLARFAPAKYVEELREALRDPRLRLNWRSYLVGLLKVSDELASDEALAILEDARVGDASLAMGILLRAGSLDAVREGARRFFRTVAREDGLNPSELTFFRGFPDAGLGPSLYDNVRRALFPDSRLPIGGEETPAPSLLYVFFPGADPSATRRSRLVFPPKRWQRLQHYARKKEYRCVSVILAKAAQEALAAASKENPLFAPLAARLKVFLDVAMAECRSVGGSSSAQEFFSSLIGTILAKAIRGRDAKREIQEGRENPATFRALLRLDEHWIEEQTFRDVLQHADPKELRKLARSSDREVRLNALALLAARDPNEDFATAWDAMPDALDPGWSRLHYACLAAGERAIDAVVRDVFHHGRSCPFGMLLFWLANAGTERARAYLAYYLDAFLERRSESPSAAVFLQQSIRLMDREIARWFVNAFRAGRIEPSLDLEADLRFLVSAFRALKDLTGVPQDPKALARQGIEAYIATHPEEAEELELEALDDDEEFFGEAEGPEDPYRRRR